MDNTDQLRNEAVSAHSEWDEKLQEDLANDEPAITTLNAFKADLYRQHYENKEMPNWGIKKHEKGNWWLPINSKWRVQYELLDVEWSYLDQVAKARRAYFEHFREPPRPLKILHFKGRKLASDDRGNE